jgi:hypothetical protein
MTEVSLVEPDRRLLRDGMEKRWFLASSALTAALLMGAINACSSDDAGKGASPSSGGSTAGQGGSTAGQGGSAHAEGGASNAAAGSHDDGGVGGANEAGSSNAAGGTENEAGAGGAAGAAGDGASGSGTLEPTCYPPPSNLVFWWNEEPYMFPEMPPFGREIREVLRHNNAGMVNTQSWSETQGLVGFAVDLGTGYMRADPPGNWPVGALEFWLKTSMRNADVVSIGSSQDSGYGVSLADAKVRLFYACPDPDGKGPLNAVSLSITSSQAVDDGKPHHVALVTDVISDNPSASLYLDGKFAASLNFTADQVASLNSQLFQAEFLPLTMGGPGDQNSFVGQIDEVSLYHDPISPAQIAGIYKAGSAGKCLPTP